MEDSGRTEGKIAYRFETPAYPENILYINVIANYACTSNCHFCSRPREKKPEPNIYEKKTGTSLYLRKSPGIEEVMEAIGSEIKPDDRELAVIGLGEPLIFLPKVAEIIRRVTADYKSQGIKTRVDTNGLVGCLYNNPDPAERLKGAGLDKIRISLNETNGRDYVKLCRPNLMGAFPHLKGFITKCRSLGIDTYVSFVTGFKNKFVETKPKEQYLEFAVSEMGFPEDRVIIRPFVEPLKK